MLGEQSEGWGKAQQGEDNSLRPLRHGMGKCKGWTALWSVAGVSDSDLWPQGVVPYLGTFLKDLVMLDAASKDELEVSGACVQRNDRTSGLRSDRRPSRKGLQEH